MMACHIYSTFQKPKKQGEISLTILSPIPKLHNLRIRNFWILVVLLLINTTQLYIPVSGSTCCERMAKFSQILSLSSLLSVPSNDFTVKKT